MCIELLTNLADMCQAGSKLFFTFTACVKWRSHFFLKILLELEFLFVLDNWKSCFLHCFRHNNIWRRENVHPSTRNSSSSGEIRSSREEESRKLQRIIIKRFSRKIQVLFDFQLIMLKFECLVRVSVAAFNYLKEETIIFLQNSLITLETNGRKLPHSTSEKILEIH